MDLLNNFILFSVKKVTSNTFIAYKMRGLYPFSEWEMMNFIDFNEDIGNGSHLGSVIS